ncbi:hypothetical protein [Aggregatilinea lenta]|uniref:hypothetical protein n=1 Tax=Aggregatilinea lenta TaxID=913108 RepID=UPI000E5A4DFC|nr:hypothetical protein [Aggregatilinea lenta]
MTSTSTGPTRLLARSTESRCRTCPPERVCAWSCAQGTSAADIVTGAALEDSADWALTPSTTPGADAIARALWEVYNR